MEQPAMVYVNGQAIYLNAEKKLNVSGTFGAGTLLLDSTGTVIPCNDTGKTEFMLQSGNNYTAQVAGLSASSHKAAPPSKVKLQASAATSPYPKPPAVILPVAGRSLASHRIPVRGIIRGRPLYRPPGH
eukprot:NODE_6224_length_559_cov_8.483796_g6059_i0.p1 GENE.NODE_6224_length_559_cov_8.483796_g6059_i0~~NODE_6224_length_559_cov_8.483796_g6059_i0.p1  ORF type:complete len:129 (-),score=10.29 NODE_6224_length_559_cov_8.483796_g6059_i0:160-546(-)